jgi:8-oxo-dGTP pyrophosphatase MutT (NUDIX family)
MIYIQMPEGFNPKFETCACFVENSGEFLSLRRLESKPFGGTWCLPGGKREKNETLTGCVKREVLEETDINLDEVVIDLAKTVYVDNAGLQYTFHMYKAHLKVRPVPKLKTTEHSEYRWVTPASALTLNMIPGQDACIQQVYRY